MKILSALLAAAAVSLAAQAQDKTAPRADDAFADPIIAKGTGVEIRQSRLDEAIASVKAGAVSRNETISSADMPLVQKRVMDDLVMNQLLIAKATDADKAKGKEEGDKRFELTKKRAVNEETLTRQLKALGLTPETLHARLSEEATAEMVMRSKVKVTDEDVKKFYDDHPGDFEQPEMVRVTHIMLLTADPKTGTPLSEDQRKAKRKLIDDLLKRVKAGEDISKLAKEYSEDPRAKETGGESTFPREGAPLEFAAAAFSLKTNQISDVVTTSLGYHIIKLSEKIPARKYDLAKVSPDIKDYLTTEEIKKIARQTYVDLRKEANVQILDPHLKAVMDTEDPASQPVSNKPAPK